MLGSIALAYWSLAFVNTVLNLLLIRRIRPVALAREPFVSVIIPARNEERAIERTVRAMLAQNYAAFEVIVVDDRSTDSTAAILYAVEDVRLNVIAGEEPPAGWLGKPWALHEGAQLARGELLMFVDADIVYAPDALRAAVGDIERSGAAMLSLFPQFEMATLGELVVLPNLTMTGLGAIPIWLGDRANITRLAIGGGTGNLIRRSEYDAIGGHEALRAAVIDDIGLARHVRANGHRTEFVRADHLISVRMYRGLAESIDGFTKNGFSTMSRSWTVLVAVVTGLAIFNVLPFALIFDPPFLAVVALITLTRVILFAAVRYPIWAALLLHPFQSLVWIYIVLRSAWITGVRQRLTWRGRTYDSEHTRFGA